jgi:hypothetical protein
VLSYHRTCYSNNDDDNNNSKPNIKVLSILGRGDLSAEGTVFKNRLICLVRKQFQTVPLHSISEATEMVQIIRYGSMLLHQRCRYENDRADKRLVRRSALSRRRISWSSDTASVTPLCCIV